MNKERILALIDTLRALPPERFSHSTWFDVPDYDNICGSTACIAGWCALANNLGDPIYKNIGGMDVCVGFERESKLEIIVGEYLGLSKYEVAVLFFPFDLAGEHMELYQGVPESDVNDFGELITVPYASLNEAINMLERGLERGTFTLSMWFE